MLSPSLDTFRIFLHVLAASIWVGGQIALAGIIPAVRRSHPDSTKTIARAFSKVAWPSFAVVFATGIWSLMAVDIDTADWSYSMTAIVHVTSAVAAGIAAAVHAIGQTKIALALGGALGLVFSVAAMFLGLLLRSGT
jgi:uncharacterized membrane protein